MEEKDNKLYQDPREVVAWYLPQSQSREVVEYYIQPTPLPVRARPTQEMPRRKRKGLVVFLITVFVLIAALIAGLIWQHSIKAREQAQKDADDDEGTASSISSIFDEKVTTIPRYKGDREARLQVVKTARTVLTAQKLYEQVNPSVVLVMTQVGDSVMLGTGVVMTEDGYVVTNAHVISGGEYCLIRLWNDMTYEAELVGYDAQADLAVLHAIDASGLPTAHFANSDDCVVGDKVYAIGNPLGIELRGTLTDGIISAIDRDITIDGQKMTTIQTTAPLNNGNSGGPLLNNKGQVIGINTLKMSHAITEQQAGVEGLGFAIPISDAAPIINALIAEGKYEGKATLGIMVQTVPTTDGGSAVLVVEVEPDRAADKAGIEPYDVILAADGQDIFTIDELLALRRDKQIGDVLTLTIYRDGETFDVSVTMLSDRY